VEYIQRIKDEFLDKSLFQTWQIVERKAYNVNTCSSLAHPCNMKKELLSDLIPPRFRVDEILDCLSAKQKEIAKRLNITKLSSDRPSGLLGQTALFEVLRNKGFDFKTYLDGFWKQWTRSLVEEYSLLYALGYLYYIRRFFGLQPIDLVKHLVEPITSVHLAMTWDANWYVRLTANMLGVTPTFISNKHIHQTINNLMGLQDKVGISVSRVMEWTGVTRSEAKHLGDIIESGWLEHRYCIVTKNTGTVKVFKKSQSKWKDLPSFFSICTSLQDDEDYFITYTEVVKDNAEGKYYEMEAVNTNIHLYDLKDQVWKLSSSKCDARSTNDIYSLLRTGDHLVPDNAIPPTRRDIFFIALLTAMDTSAHSKKKQQIMEWFIKGYGIPKAEVENGIRNVLRKNMLRNQYTLYSIMGSDRESFTLTFDDKSKRVIPFLGEVLSNLPFSWLQMDREMGYGIVFDFHPPYLSGDLRTLIESSMKEHDVNGELFVLQSWGLGQPGSILRLVPDG
jgi:hypothetical protein